MAILGWLLESAYGQQTPCDPKALKLARPNDPAQYKLREQRCEGVYNPQTAGVPAIAIGSYFSSFESYDVGTDQLLNVRWRAPGGSAKSLLHLRGYSINVLNQGRQYQMDTLPLVGMPQFDWPLQVIRDVRLERPNLAVLAWVSYKTAGGDRDVYLPLQITRATSGGSSASDQAQISVIPGRPLDEVYLTVKLLDDSLREVKTLKSKARVRDIAYPLAIPKPISFEANVPKPIPLGSLGFSGDGFYSITLAADLKNGPSFVADPVILYYARP